MKTQQPHWQPISMLPVFTDMVDGMLEAALAQLDNLQRAADTPHVLDDATLNRVIELNDNQMQDHWLFEEQFARWKREPLSHAQAKEVDRLTQQSSKLKGTNEAIRAIVHRLAESTIDKIMAMDETELALAVLSGKLKPPT